jgi:hypothetical protein
MRALVLLSCIALVVAAGAQATTARGTLAGVVTRGPTAPVCKVGQPCTEPAKNVTLQFWRNSRVRGKAVTDAEGRYRLRLAAGVYTVKQPGAVTLGRRVVPGRVRVAGGRLTRADFFIDTGIR